MNRTQRDRSACFLPTALSVAVGSVLSPSLTAQEESGGLMLEEVVVTAQKREETLQDVSVSVLAVSGEQLRNFNITDLQNLQQYVPNFTKQETAAGSLLKIRGIGSGVNQGFEQSVVQYMDDVALGRAPLARMPFLDLA